MVQFGGDQEALSGTLYETARPENKTPAPLANLESMIAGARHRNGAEPNYVSIAHYGQADATVSINTVLPGDELVYSTFVYDGTTGAFLREQPPLGRIPSLGASLVGIMYPLHFGNFAGIASKAVWLGLGTAAAYVFASNANRHWCGSALHMMLATVLAIAFSGAPLILLGARDPKRMRNALHAASKASSTATLPKAMNEASSAATPSRTMNDTGSAPLRRVCGWSVLAPGVALGFAGQWWAFLLWLGASTAFGWAIAITAALESRRAPVSTNE